MEAEEDVVEKMRGAFVDRKDVAEIEDEAFEFGQLGELADDELGGGKDEVALKLNDLDGAAVLAQRLGLGFGAHAAGVEFGGVQAQAEGGFADAGAVEKVEVPAARERAAHANAANAVAFAVEPRKRRCRAGPAGPR